MRQSNPVAQVYPMQLSLYRPGVAPVGFAASSPRRLWSCLATLAFVVTSFTSPVAADDPDLPEIARRLQEWRKSFATLDLTYHAWNREQFEARFEEAKSLEDLDGRFYRKHRMIWTDSGYLYRENWTFEEGILVDRSTSGTNGTVYFRGSTGRMKPKDEWASVQIYPIISAPDTGLLFEPLSCLWWNESWLGDILARSDAAILTGYEIRDGARCAVVNIDKPSRRQKDVTLTLRLWLDADRDFLPHWHERDMSPVWPTLSAPQCFAKYSVTDFKKLDNGRWFPMRGFMKAGGDNEPGNEWVVKEVSINKSFQASQFQPPQKAKQVETSVQPSVDEKTIAEVVALSQSNSSQFVAAPPIANWRIVLYVSASAILLAVGLWLKAKSG